MALDLIEGNLTDIDAKDISEKTALQNAVEIGEFCEKMFGKQLKKTKKKELCGKNHKDSTKKCKLSCKNKNTQKLDTIFRQVLRT